MEKFYGNYLGIVIKTDDPEGRHRVKVFVPHISATLYEQWNAVPEDKVFNFPGDNTSPDLSGIKERLEQILPWAEQVSPLIGSGSAGSYNGTTNAGSTYEGDNTNTPNAGQKAYDFNDAVSNGKTFDKDIGVPTIDNDGIQRPTVSDPDYQAQTSLGGLNAQTQAYVVAPTGGPKLGTKVIITNKKTGVAVQGVVGDHSDNGSGRGHYSEISSFAAKAIGIYKYNAIVKRTGRHVDDVNQDGVIVTYNPSEEQLAKLKEQGPAMQPAVASSTDVPNDGHTDTITDPVNRANAYGSGGYQASSGSNAAKGIFSCPNVGAHVWVFFQGGDHMHPAYFGYAFSSADVASALNAGSPAEFGDQTNTLGNGTGNRRRPLTVLNLDSGVTRYVGTDGNRQVINNDYHGNTTRTSARGVSIYTPANYQILVGKDLFQTINNDKNVVVRNNYDLCVYGDIKRTIGHINSYFEPMKKIIEMIKDPHNDVAKFEHKRAEGNYPMTRGSTDQTKSGTHAPCPVCAPGDKYKVRQSKPNTLSVTGMEYNEAPDSEKGGIITAGTSQIKEITLGTTGKIAGLTCPACDGSGKSPSSEHGKWDKDDAKVKAAQKMLQQMDALSEHEAKLGPGGSEILTIAKDYIVSVGLHMNDMEAVRTDLKGKMIPNAMKVGPKGTFKEQSEVPIMEIIPQHPAFPGGNYDFTVMNKYNLMTGSGGISFKTKGVVQLGGSITNINSDQLLLTTMNETKFTAGKSFSVLADNIHFSPVGNAQVMVDGGLGVSRNVVVGGGMHVEGEVSLHHITAPVEYQMTELEAPGGITKKDVIIGYVKSKIADDGDYVLVEYNGGKTPIYGNGEKDTIVVDAHRHIFKNLPLTLHESSDDVRDSAKHHNKPEALVAKATGTKGKSGPIFDYPDKQKATEGA